MVVIVTVKVELEVGIALSVLVARVELVRGRVDGLWSGQLQRNIVDTGRLLLHEVLIPPCIARHTHANHSLNSTRTTRVGNNRSETDGDWGLGLRVGNGLVWIGSDFYNF